MPTVTAPQAARYEPAPPTETAFRRPPGRDVGAPPVRRSWRPSFGSRIWVKLAAIAVVFAIPLATTTWLLLEEKAIKIDFAQHELQGDEYLRAASSLLQATATYRSAVKTGDAARLTTARAAVDSALVELARVDGRLADDLGTTREALAERVAGDGAPGRLGSDQAFRRP